MKIKTTIHFLLINKIDLARKAEKVNRKRDNVVTSSVNSNDVQNRNTIELRSSLFVQIAPRSDRSRFRAAIEVLTNNHCARQRA